MEMFRCANSTCLLVRVDVRVAAAVKRNASNVPPQLVEIARVSAKNINYAAALVDASPLACRDQGINSIDSDGAIVRGSKIATR
jgi:hypothetical protein